MSVQTHNTVEDQSQRPTSDIGGVYSYEAIAAVAERPTYTPEKRVRLRKSAN